MLIKCSISSELWSSIEGWIKDVEVIDYELTDKEKVLDELDKLIGCSKSYISR